MDVMSYYILEMQYQEAKMKTLRKYKQLLEAYDNPDISSDDILDLSYDIAAGNKVCLDLRDSLIELTARNTTTIMKGESIWN